MEDEIENLGSEQLKSKCNDLFLNFMEEFTNKKPIYKTKDILNKIMNEEEIRVGLDTEEQRRNLDLKTVYMELLTTKGISAKLDESAKESGESR